MKNTTYQMGFFDHAGQLARLDKLGDKLAELSRIVDFEMFRAPIEKALGITPRTGAGRPAFDCIFLFRILLLQRFYNLSDQQIEYQINDRLSFQRFLGLDPSDPAPDYTTVWLFREKLSLAGAIKPLFDLFVQKLGEHGLIAKEGVIIDATFVEVPRQRNTREENALLKHGQIPPAWEKQPRKLCQKDTDARWVKKGGESYFGYKNHNMDEMKNQFIVDYIDTDAAVHDSQPFPKFVKRIPCGSACFADSAYKSKKTDALLDTLGIKNFMLEKATRGHPLSEARKALNHLKSKIRCLCEHVFGFMENSMGGPRLEYIGKRRIGAGIGLTNLAYNIQRLLQIHKLGRAPSWPCCAQTA
jgi:IS5 family transposase